MTAAVRNAATLSEATRELARAVVVVDVVSGDVAAAMSGHQVRRGGANTQFDFS